jgi:hypothetical protein
MATGSDCLGPNAVPRHGLPHGQDFGHAPDPRVPVLLDVSLVANRIAALDGLGSIPMGSSPVRAHVLLSLYGAKVIRAAEIDLCSADRGVAEHALQAGQIAGMVAGPLHGKVVAARVLAHSRGVLRNAGSSCQPSEHLSDAVRYELPSRVADEEEFVRHGRSPRLYPCLEQPPGLGIEANGRPCRLRVKC